MIDPEEKQDINLDDIEPTETDLQNISQQECSHIDLFEDLDDIDDYGWIDWFKS